jgi:hypothetical protein
MAYHSNRETVLMLDKEATWQRLLERKNTIKRNHFATGGTKRNSPVKQSKIATWNAINRLYLKGFDIKKRYRKDTNPRLQTSYYRLAGANDASARTMARHLAHLISLGLIRGYQRLQRGIQILLDPTLFVWTDVPVKWYPRPQNSPAAVGSCPVAATSAAADTNAPLDAQSPVDEVAEAASIMAELRKKFAQIALKAENTQLAQNQG